MTNTPYSKLQSHAFWRTGVTEKTPATYQNLWQSKWELPSDAAFATYGSCFAQHISRALTAKEIPWVNAEPAPPTTSNALATKFNYGIYSSRTGNIYTIALLLQWLELAIGHKSIDDIEIWKSTRFQDRYVISIMPNIEPEGLESIEEARAILNSTIQAFKRSIEGCNVFVFTMGLTEGWEHRKTRQVYAMCPGTLDGTFDEAQHIFKNYRYPEITLQLEAALKLLQEINPSIHVLLTVSPIPLTATAENQHVLVSSTYSKSTLRAIGGDFAHNHANVDYFPSYEVIASSPSRGQYFEENLRSVNGEGVETVMSHFFAGLNLGGQSQGRIDPLESAEAERIKQEAADDLVCEEIILEQQNT